MFETFVTAVRIILIRFFRWIGLPRIAAKFDA